MLSSSFSVILLSALAFTLLWVDKRAIFRGQRTGLTSGDGRKPLAPIADKSLRVAILFLGFLVPSYLFLSPWICVPLVLYLPFYIDNSEKFRARPFVYFRKTAFWHFLNKRMNLSLIKTQELDPSKQYILAAHPHGILPLGCIANLLSDLNQASDILKIRDLLLGCGIVDASRVYAESLLRSGRNIGVFPGGAPEALHARPGQDVVCLRKRRGFVHLALCSGAALVPVYTFGETDCYDQLPCEAVPLLPSFQRVWQRVFGLSLPLITNLVPRRCRVTTVVGPALPARRAAGERPTAEEVEALHDEYVAALRRLYDEWHDRCLPERAGRGQLVVL